MSYFFDDIREKKNIWTSIKIFLSVVAIEAIILIALLIFGFNLGLAMFIFFIAPIIEELGTRKSIEKNCIGSYFTVFNVIEFFGYTIANPKTTLLRFAIVFMHYCTTKIQKHYYITEKDHKTGLVLAIIIHSLWNFFAVYLATKF